MIEFLLLSTLCIRCFVAARIAPVAHHADGMLRAACADEAFGDVGDVFLRHSASLAFRLLHLLEAAIAHEAERHEASCVVARSARESLRDAADARRRLAVALFACVVAKLLMTVPRRRC